MYSKGITGLLLILIAGILPAQEVDQPTAEKVARRFFTDHHPSIQSKSTKISLELETTPEIRNDTLLWFKIDIAGEGFVFVSGDVRCTPVLAYGYRPLTPEIQQPEACREWFDWYARQILMVKRNNLPAGKSISDLWTAYSGNPGSAGETLLDEGIGPLTVSEWGQRYYYNSMCPVDPAGPGGHAIAGCVATAMAQVLFYYRFPEHGEGSHGYASDYGYEFADFEAAEYRWDEMVNRIHYWPNPEIAELIYHSAVSVEMNFGPNASGAMTADAMDALRNHFRYNPGMNFISKFSLGSAFKDSVIANLDQHRVLLYRGGGLGGSHSFVCDGYQDTSYFHFNWGWDGGFNGYYTMENLNPNVYDFTFDQEAVINIYPREDYPAFCQGEKVLTGLRGTLEDGSGPETYLPGQSCQWLLQPGDPSFSNIRIWFTRLDTDPDGDIVRIFDGPDPGSPLLGAFSGSALPPTLEPSGNTLFIEFEAGSTSPGQGWQMEYFAYKSPFCNPLQQFQAMNLPWMEDGSGPYDYINGSDCGWLLAPQQANTDSIGSIDLYFHWFELAGGDTLFVYDGPGNTSPVLAKLTGSILPDTVHSTNNQIYINFRADGTTSAAGWAGGYRSKLPVYCHDTLLYTEKTGILEDGSSDKSYVPNTNCFWLIQTENSEYITVEFLEFDLEYGYDQVRFYDASKTPPQLFATYWGHDLPAPFNWYSNKVLIQFTTDGSEQFDGWKLKYTAVTPGFGDREFQDNLSLYPNPAGERIFITGLPPGRSAVTAEILDMQLKVHRKIEMEKTHDGPFSLNVQGLPPGVYVVRIGSDQGSSILKLIIQ